MPVLTARTPPMPARPLSEAPAEQASVPRPAGRGERKIMSARRATPWHIGPVIPRIRSGAESPRSEQAGRRRDEPRRTTDILGRTVGADAPVARRNISPAGTGKRIPRRQGLRDRLRIGTPRSACARSRPVGPPRPATAHIQRPHTSGRPDASGGRPRHASCGGGNTRPERPHTEHSGPEQPVSVQPR